MYGGSANDYYIAWLAAVVVLGSLAYLALSFIFKKVHYPFYLTSRYLEFLRIFLTISFLAIHGLLLYKKGLGPIKVHYELTFVALATLIAAYTTWMCFGLMFKAIHRLVRFMKFTKEDRWVILAFTACSALTSIFINLLTSVFYQYDKIFSLDTGHQLKTDIINNTYSSYTGIRHIGESVMTAPLGALATPLRNVFWFIPHGEHLIILASFSLLIVVSSVLTVRMLQLKDRLYRLSFHLLYLLSFPVLIFSSMFEQYVPSVFFTILFVFFIWTYQKKRSSVDYTAIPRPQHKLVAIVSMVLSGMGVLTSFFAGLLFIRRGIKPTLVSLSTIVLVAILFVLASGQLLTVAFGLQEYAALKSFMSLELGERINIYSHFLTNTITNTSMYLGDIPYGSGVGVIDSPSLPSQLNPYGIVLLTCSITGVVIGIRQKNPLFYVSGLWVILSVIIIIGFGWGATNNESTLYTYYFSFAFIAGMFNLYLSLSNFASRKYGISKRLSGWLLLAIVIIISYVNITQFTRIIDFGTTHYPVDMRKFIRHEASPN